MLPFLAKAMIPIVTVFVTAVGVLQGIDYVKGKFKKTEKSEEVDDEYV
jgi:hypothetical protein